MSARSSRREGDLGCAGALDVFGDIAPLLERKDQEAPSAFWPWNMLREDRRQKALDCGHVPLVCVIDPDGDIVSHVQQTYPARLCLSSGPTTT
jgi:hypothetical protein